MNDFILSRIILSFPANIFSPEMLPIILTFHRNTCSVLLTLSQTDKILAVTKLKAFSDDNSNFA